MGQELDRELLLILLIRVYQNSKEIYQELHRLRQTIAKNIRMRDSNASDSCYSGGAGAFDCNSPYKYIEIELSLIHI